MAIKFFEIMHLREQEIAVFGWVLSINSRATYTVNVLAARITRQMSVIGTKAMAEADMENGLVK